MANNQNVNKVEFGNDTIMDITDTTAQEADVAAGAVFYKASGARSVGTYDGSDKMDLVDSPTAGNLLTTDANGQAQDSGQALSGVALKSELPTIDQTFDGTSANAQSGAAIQPELTNLQTQIDGLGEPFRLQDFTQQINLTIPHCNQDIANTSIPNVDIDLDIIDPTGALNQDFAIAGLAKYEVYDATSGGNRLNCWPVCSFSMNGQRVLRVRMMVAGSTAKTARRISGALLLKHR